MALSERKASVFVKGPDFKDQTEHMFLVDGYDKYKIVNSINQADIVVLTGGNDICPALYGEKAIQGVTFGDRDISDLQVLHVAWKKNKFLVGICRGGQLLNCVPNGGKLWQDVDGHEGPSHAIYDMIGEKWLTCNSSHHQQMIPTKEAQIVAWSMQCSVKESDGHLWTAPKEFKDWVESDKDIEALWYEKTRSLCFQPHPEWAHKETTLYFFRLMNEFYWKDGK